MPAPGFGGTADTPMWATGQPRYQSPGAGFFRHTTFGRDDVNQGAAMYPQFRAYVPFRTDIGVTGNAQVPWRPGGAEDTPGSWTPQSDASAAWQEGDLMGSVLARSGIGTSPWNIMGGQGNAPAYQYNPFTGQQEQVPRATAVNPTVLPAEPAGDSLGRALPADNTTAPTYSHWTQDPRYGQSLGSMESNRIMGIAAYTGSPNATGNTGDAGHNIFNTGQGSRFSGRIGADGVLTHVPTSYNAAATAMNRAIAGGQNSGAPIRRSTDPSSYQRYNDWIMARTNQQVQTNMTPPAAPVTAGGDTNPNQGNGPRVQAAEGFRVPGPPSDEDTVPADLARGEVVIDADTVAAKDAAEGPDWPEQMKADATGNDMDAVIDRFLGEPDVPQNVPQNVPRRTEPDINAVIDRFLSDTTETAKAVAEVPLPIKKKPLTPAEVVEAGETNRALLGQFMAPFGMEVATKEGIDPAKSTKWNEMQAASQAMADEAGLPKFSRPRDQLIDAISRSEKAGYPVQHFIGKPDEPTGDRGVTMDVENLVAALRQRAIKDPAAAKELAYWERDLASGMTAAEWKSQTGEADPRYPVAFASEAEEPRTADSLIPADITDAAVARQQDEKTLLANSPQWLRNAAEAATETALDFIPRSALGVAELLTPVPGAVEHIKKTYGMARDLINGKSFEEANHINFPESEIFTEADKTPPLSKERFKAVFGMLAQLGMVAVGGRAIAKMGGHAKPTVVEPVVPVKGSKPVEEIVPPEPKPERMVNEIEPNKTQAAVETEKPAGPITDARTIPSSPEETTSPIGTEPAPGEVLGARNEPAPLAPEPGVVPEPGRAGVDAAAPSTSKIGKSIEAKAVEAKLTEGFAETALYDPITIADQAQRATGLIKSSINDARAVIRGDAPLPEGLRGTSLITAMEEQLLRKPDAQAAYELANSPLTSATSLAAQEMRLMAERVPDSITAKFQEIREARRAGSKQRGETPERIFQDIKTEVVRQSSKRPTWEAFVREITCV